MNERVAIVTGGTGALGRAVAKLFANSGAKLSIPYIVGGEVPLIEEELGPSMSQVSLSKIDMFKWRKFRVSPARPKKGLAGSTFW